MGDQADHTETRNPPNYLDPRNLAQLNSIELRARMMIEGMMIGMHRSAHLGFSIEFAQHRPYAPGDDLRHLDWKVFARTDKLYVKQYQKDTHLDLVILVDVSGSMGFTSDRRLNWRKYDHAASLAAALAYVALQQQDRVGLHLFSDRVIATRAPSNATDHWRWIVEALGEVKLEEISGEQFAGGKQEIQDAGTDLGRLFDEVVATVARRSLIVLISDLFDDPDTLDRALARLRFRRHDLIVLQVLDHAELTFPYRGPAEFYGLEGEGRLPFNPAALRAAYLDTLQAHLGRIAQVTRRFGFDYLLVDTSESLGASLSHFLAARATAISKSRRVSRQSR